MKKIIWIAGIVLLVALAVGGGFWAGMTYQTNQVEQVRADFENERGPAPVGQAPDGGAQGFGGEGMPGRPSGGLAGAGTTGVVKTIDGDTITLSTATDVTTVSISDSTQLEKNVATEITDLEVGMQVLVSGQQSDNGVISANQITILDDSQGALPILSQPPNPAPTETEP